MRKRQFNRGRWLVERERHQLDAEAPPETGAGIAVAPVVRALIRHLSMNDQIWLAELEATWSTIVGAGVASHTRPGRYEHNTLTVFVDHSVWLSELSRNGQKLMLSKLQARFSAERIRSLRLQIDPGQPPRRPAERRGPPT